MWLAAGRAEDYRCGPLSELHGDRAGCDTLPPIESGFIGLLADVFVRCVAVAAGIGAAFIVLNAISEDAGRLYRDRGFHDLPIPGQETRMLISMTKLRAAVEAA